MKKMMNLRRRNRREGIMFVTPFILGTIVFFLYPLGFSIYISLGEYTITKGGFSFVPEGLKNYIDAFVQNMNFTTVFSKTVMDSLINTPLVVVFSLIIAIMLNKKIVCRGLFRTIFFLPFLLGTGYVMRQLLGMNVTEGAMSMARGIILPGWAWEHLPVSLLKLADGFLNRITYILWKSGVPIILFLSGLQSINKALYESAQVDGATEWEVLWKITIPMTTPIMLLVMVFSIIDSFNDPNNPMVDLFYNTAFLQQRYSQSAAMSWIYFLFILLFVGLIFLIMRRFIYSDR